MNEKELCDNKIVCLKQLRLSKWQLIWNREFELGMLENVDKAAIDKAEITGVELPPDMLEKIKAEYDHKFRTKQTETEYAKLEIQVLDRAIEELEAVFKANYA